MRARSTTSATLLCGAICAADRLLHWVKVSADGFETATTFSNDDPTLPTWPSNPPIYCTSDPQAIDLVMHPVGVLRVITHTAGAGADPDGYILQVGGDNPSGGVNYAIGIDEELVREIRPGAYSLQLVQVAENCVVAGDNPRTVTVAARH